MDVLETSVSSRVHDSEHREDATLEMGDGVLLSNPSTKLYRTLKPFILTMKVLGMYFLDKTTFNNCCKGKALLGYSLFHVLVLWGSFGWYLRYVSQMKNINGIIGYGSNLVWYFYCSCQGVIVFLLCLRKSGWQQFFYRQELAQRGIWPAITFKEFRKHVIVYVIICWSFITVYGGIQMYQVFFNFDYGVVTSCFVFASRLHSTTWWTVPTILSIMINDFLATEFKLFNTRLEKEVRECPLQLCNSLGVIRNMYGRLADVANSANTLLSNIVLGSITASLIAVCCQLYLLVYDNEADLLVRIDYGSVLLATLLTLFLIIGTCAWVKTKVSHYHISPCHI